MTIHAIIWDIGGVLLRTHDFAPRAALAQQLNMTPTEVEQMVFGKDDNFRAQFGEISYDQHWQNVAARMSMTQEEVVALREAFFASDILDTGLVDRIRTYKSQGFCSAVLSNFWDKLRDHIYHDWKIDDAFHKLIISSEIGLMKPDPAIYQYLLEEIGFEAEETVFLDDFIENVNAACEAGMHAIHFQNKVDALNKLEKLIHS